jgi:hypothetical protein
VVTISTEQQHYRLDSEVKTHDTFNEKVSLSLYPYDRLTAAMDTHTEAVDVYCILKPVFLYVKG